MHLRNACAEVFVLAFFDGWKRKKIIARTAILGLNQE